MHARAREGAAGAKERRVGEREWRLTGKIRCLARAPFALAGRGGIHGDGLVFPILNHVLVIRLSIVDLAIQPAYVPPHERVPVRSAGVESTSRRAVRAIRTITTPRTRRQRR